MDRTQPHKWGALLRLYVSVGVWGFGYLLRLWLRETAAPKKFPRLARGFDSAKMASKIPRKKKSYRYRFTTPLRFLLPNWSLLRKVWEKLCAQRYRLSRTLSFEQSLEDKVGNPSTHVV